MLDLTRQEKRVIIFLMASGLLGAGILCYKGLRYRPKIEIVSGRDQNIEKEIAASKIININTATKEEIMRLKGIGPSLSEAIMEYRAAHGGFKDKEEIKLVKGIGQAKFDEIKDSIKTQE